MRVPALVSYERGRPMPLYRGATSKAILAFLPQRELKALVERDRAESARAGLGPDGAALRQVLEPVRQQRFCVTDSEIDPGVCGVAVPLFERSRVIGSLSVVLPSAAMRNGGLQRATRQVVRAGHRIDAGLEHAEPKRFQQNKAK